LSLDKIWCWCNKLWRYINAVLHDGIRPYFLLAFYAEISKKELELANHVYLKIPNFLDYTTSLFKKLDNFVLSGWSRALPILPNVFSCYVTILYTKISSFFVRHGSSKISSQSMSSFRIYFFIPQIRPMHWLDQDPNESGYGSGFNESGSGSNISRESGSGSGPNTAEKIAI